MPALLLGSISTLADTSELQRKAFNAAFAEHGLDWHWDQPTYAAALSTAGGQDRIAAHAAESGESVDAAEVHRTKSRLFQERLAAGGLTARPGVVDTIAASRAAGHRVCLVTTTSAANVAALLDALPNLSASDFDVVIDASDDARPKPHPAAYELALDRLGEQSSTCVAVEDNVDGVGAAVAAGLVCVAFPNENTVGHGFGLAHHVVDRLDAADLAQLTPLSA